MKNTDNDAVGNVFRSLMCLIYLKLFSLAVITHRSLCRLALMVTEMTDTLHGHTVLKRSAKYTYTAAGKYIGIAQGHGLWLIT